MNRNLRRLRMFSMRRIRVRRGFTLIETLVAIGIIGLLASLIVPAVQSVRESSRRVECTNHLKQIVLACQEHEATHHVYPVPFVDREHWNVRILPYLEQPKPILQANGVQTGGASVVSILRCPSDSYATGAVGGMSGESYFPNDGYGLWASNGFYRSKSGDPIQTKLFSDGLSNTMAISERLVLLPSLEAYDYSSLVWYHRVVRKTVAFIGDIDSFADECENRSSSPLTRLVIEPSYNSVQTPNRHSCSNGQPNDPVAVSHGAYTASSQHPGGVSVAMVDGSVRFISDYIDINAWRALSTRDGLESNGDF